MGMTRKMRERIERRRRNEDMAEDIRSNVKVRMTMAGVTYQQMAMMTGISKAAAWKRVNLSCVITAQTIRWLSCVLWCPVHTLKSKHQADMAGVPVPPEGWMGLVQGQLMNGRTPTYSQLIGLAQQKGELRDAILHST